MIGMANSITYADLKFGDTGLKNLKNDRIGRRQPHHREDGDAAYENVKGLQRAPPTEPRETRHPPALTGESRLITGLRRFSPVLLLLLLCLALAITVVMLAMKDGQASSHQEETSKNLTLTRTELEKTWKKLELAAQDITRLKISLTQSQQDVQTCTANQKKTLSEMTVKQSQLDQLMAVQHETEFKIDSWKKAFSLFKGAVITDKKIFTSLGLKDNYNGARDKCMEAGGQLASPENKEENDAVSAITKMYRVKSFLGINDRETEGDFKLLSGKTITFSNWRAGEPNNLGRNEDCVEMWESTGEWNDQKCWETRLVICEYVTAKD